MYRGNDVTKAEVKAITWTQKNVLMSSTTGPDPVTASDHRREIFTLKCIWSIKLTLNPVQTVLMYSRMEQAATKVAEATMATLYIFQTEWSRLLPK